MTNKEFYEKYKDNVLVEVEGAVISFYRFTGIEDSYLVCNDVHFDATDNDIEIHYSSTISASYFLNKEIGGDVYLTEITPESFDYLMDEFQKVRMTLYTMFMRTTRKIIEHNESNR